MYNVLLDENKFYTGICAKVGKVDNGTDVNELPPEENQLCYYLSDASKEVESTVNVYESYMYKDSDETETEYHNNADDLDVLDQFHYNMLPDTIKVNYSPVEVPKRVECKLTDDEVSELIEEEKKSVYLKQAFDEEGNPVTKTITNTVYYKEWKYSEEKYAELNADAVAKAIAEKEKELGETCTELIYSGTDAKVGDKVYHFSLEEKDQIKIVQLYNIAISTSNPVYWHPDKAICQSFTAEEFKVIGETCLSYVSYHETLINHLNRYVESLTSLDDIKAVEYSADSLNDEYRENLNKTLSDMGITV